MRLELTDLCFAYLDQNAADHVSLHVDDGEFVGLIGPNGSGKSTVLKTLYRALPPDSGSATLDGEDLLRMSHKQAARKIGVVGQEHDLAFDFTVEEIVAMGRSPHKALFDMDTADDRRIIRHALTHMGMEHMAARPYSRLSGGEKQRVLIARVIAQEADFLILDEPTNHLDVSYQMEIFDLVKRLNVSVLSAMHDLNMAALYCDRIYVLKEGRICCQGTPEQVLTPELLRDVFRIQAEVAIHPTTRRPVITYLPVHLQSERK